MPAAAPLIVWAMSARRRPEAWVGQVRQEPAAFAREQIQHLAGEFAIPTRLRIQGAVVDLCHRYPAIHMVS